MATAALTVVRDRIRRWTVIDFLELYQRVTPMFHCLDINDYNTIYMSLKDSVDALIDLLLFQFHSLSDVISFLKTVYDVCNRESGKMNSIFIHGDSNAGKNFYTDCLSSFFLNVGMINNPNKYERFPFMDCVDRRIVVWNEARMDPAFYDDIKQVLAGDCLKVNVKHQAPIDVVRVPVIVLSNSQFLPGNDEFSNRMYRFEWRKCSLLKRFVNAKPLPVAAGLLLYWSQHTNTPQDLQCTGQYIDDWLQLCEASIRERCINICEMNVDE